MLTFSRTLAFNPDMTLFFERISVMATDYQFFPTVEDRGVKAFRGGTHRLIDPEKTVQRVARFMPIMGITRIANITGLDTIGLPVVMVVRPNSRSVAVSQGKGLTIAAAKASGLMESVESYHAEQITLPLKLASYEELCYTHPMIDVGGLPFHKGGSFQSTTRVLWTEGHDIVNDQSAWLPYELVHTNYTLPMPSGSGNFVPSSNGLASGNHLLEATSHALHEVVERDSTTLWNLRSPEDKAKTCLDLSTVDDPDCCTVLEKYEQVGMTVGVWETTSDVGLPAYKCSIVDRQDQAFRRMYAASGYGCHPTRRIALLRALTEAAQSRLTMISGSRDDVYRSDYERTRNTDIVGSVRDEILSHSPTRHFHDAPNFEGETFADDIQHALDCLENVGIQQVVVVNLTKPMFRIPVMRVVIPGLETNDDIPSFTFGQRAIRFLKKQGKLAES